MSVPFLPIIALLSSAPVDTTGIQVDPIAVATEIAVSSTAAPEQSKPPEPAASPVPAPVTPPAATPPAATAATVPADDGEILVTARTRIAADPAQAINEVSFDAVQGVDKAFVAPISLAYKKTVPKPVRSGLRNFLTNLQEPVIFLNFMLQLKVGKAAETFGRFAINSTVGVGGLMDVAKKKPFYLPHRPNGFAYTLGFYGVKPGPYLFLPLIGPTTVRDLIGRTADLTILPSVFGKPFNNPVYSVTTTAIKSIDERAEDDGRLSSYKNGKTSTYEAIRTWYLTKRQAEIDELRAMGHKKKAAPLLPTPAVPVPAVTPPPSAAPQ